MAEKLHLSSPMDISIGYDKAVGTMTWQGAVDDLLAMMEKTRFQDSWEEADNEVSEVLRKAYPSHWNTVFAAVTDMRMNRGTAGRGSLSCTVAMTRNMAVWGIDFSEVSKDIRTWHQDSSFAEEERPDLSAISSWEALKGDSAHIQMYTNFRYFDGTTQKEMERDSPTRKLAEMMYRGIENYPIYIPVLTCQATSAMYNNITAEPWGEAGAHLSAEMEPEDLPDFDFVGGVSCDIIMSSVRENQFGKTRRWLVTADRITINGDGSYSRTMQWTGLDDIEENLYKTLGGEGGED